MSDRNPLLTPDMVPQIVPDKMLGLSTERLRNLGAGTVKMAPEALRFLGMLTGPEHAYRTVTDPNYRGEANPVARTLSGAGDASAAIVNKAFGVTDPSLLDDTENAMLQITGGAVVGGLPAAARQGFQQLPKVVRAGARVLEALSPGTFTTATSVPGKAAAVTANVVAQTAAGIALEKVVEPRDPTLPYETRDPDGNLIERYTPAPGTEAGAGRVVARAVGSAVGDNPVAATLGAGAAIGLGALGYRGLRNAARQRESMANSPIVQPLDRSNTDVPIIDTSTTRGKVNDALHEVGETLQDANIRTKEAVRQSDPKGYEATRDAIDATGESYHADRVIASFENGRIETPRGSRLVGSLKGIAEDIYHKTLNNPELSKKVKELIVLENAADERQYALRKEQQGDDVRVLIDSRTGEELTAGHNVPQAFVEKVLPRATLWHVSDNELARRINDLRVRNPDADVLAIVDRYHDLHKKLADAWVDFGLVSRAEREAWGRANPNFMHTINMDDPKSPRTYRIRKHGNVKEAGDPLLSAAEYQDFMLGHVMRNRQNEKIYDSLRSKGGGPYGNGEWIGKIADPEVVRRTFIRDPITGVSRQMTMKDALDTLGNGGAEVRHFYRNGEKVSFEVLNPVIAKTMDKIPQHVQSLGGYLRNLAQSGMTGKLATAVGQPFFAANAVMGSIAGQINRPAGRSLGYFDRKAQEGSRYVAKALFNKDIKGIGIRGDPTAYVGMVHSGARDVGAILTRAVADAFHNSLTHNGLLAKIPNAQGIADGAARKYLASVYAERHTTGAGSPSTLGDRDFDTSGNRATKLGAAAPHANLARVVSDPKNMMEQLELFKARMTPADVKIAVRTLTDIQEAMGNLAQSYLYRSNRGKRKELDEAAKIPEQLWQREIDAAKARRVDRDRYRLQEQTARQHNMPVQANAYKALAEAEELAAEAHDAAAAPHRQAADRAREAWFNELQSLSVATRQLLGDPGMMGTALRDRGKPGQGKVKGAIGTVIDWTPYSSIGIQASAALLRAARQNPMGTATAFAMTLGPLVYAGIKSAIAYDDDLIAKGQEPMAMKFDMALPAWAQTRYVRIYIPGVPLENTVAVRLDPLLSFPYTLAREGLIRHFNLIGDPRSDPSVGKAREHILEISRSRSQNNIATSALNAQPFSQYPPAVGAAAAYMGYELPGIDKLFTRGASPIPTRGMGGVEGTRLANDTTSKTFDAVMAQIFGGASLTAIEAFRAGHQTERRNPGTFFRGAGDVIKGKAMDRFNEISPLFSQQQRIATNDHMADLVNAKESSIKTLSGNMAAITRPGSLGVGRGKQDGGEGGGIQGLDDPNMRELAVNVTSFGNRMKVLQDARSTVRTQMLNVEQRGLPWADQRLELNRLSRQITRLNSELLAEYVDFEDRMGDKFGGRVIRLENIDPTKPITQFPTRR